jgi:uncharacterized membrane protein
MVLAAHIAAAGVWLGCILVEVFFERALAPDEANREVLAVLHRKVDLFVETPAFATVLATGVAMFGGSPMTPSLAVMTGFGALAVIANVVCVFLVILRDAKARMNDWAGYEKADHLQHKVGAVVLFSVLAAMAAGLWGAAA